MQELRDLLEFISTLRKTNAIHVRRGFPINTTTITSISNHLLEETVELQAAALLEGKNEQYKEAADVLGAYLHLLDKLNLDFANVVLLCRQQLQENFTTDPSRVTAVTPGLTRSYRGPGPPELTQEMILQEELETNVMDLSLWTVGLDGEAVPPRIPVRIQWSREGIRVIVGDATDINAPSVMIERQATSVCCYCHPHAGDYTAGVFMYDASGNPPQMVTRVEDDRGNVLTEINGLPSR